MALTHDFLLLDRIDEAWTSAGFDHDPRATVVHDDVISYIWDTLRWIPAYNPGRRQACSGLNYHGETIIDHRGAEIAGRVFHGWAELFRAGPPSLALTGRYNDDQGEYETLVFERDELCGLMERLGEYAACVERSPERLYIYHSGI